RRGSLVPIRQRCTHSCVERRTTMASFNERALSSTCNAGKRRLVASGRRIADQMNRHCFSRSELSNRPPSKVLHLILTSALLGTATSSLDSSWADAQGSDDWRKEVQDLLQDTERSFAQFREMRREAQQLREQERARISDYTAALAKATLALQKHIADLHPRNTNCQTCRKQVKELQALIKKIGQILE